VRCGSGASGVKVRRFRSSCDLPAVIDLAGLPVISAQRGKGAHIVVLPKKRTTLKPCGELANVFVVWIWNRGFGHAHHLPMIVDRAPVHPTVRSSKRAEIGLDSIDVYHRTSV